VWFKGDHEPCHVHVFDRDNRLLGRVRLAAYAYLESGQPPAAVVAIVKEFQQSIMKTYAEPKPLGTATFEPIRAVRYLDDEDIFEVEFESGETFAVPHEVIRRANGISNAGEVDSVWIEAEVRAGFLIRYKDGELADCAWDFVKETP